MDNKQTWLSDHKPLIETLLNQHHRAIDISQYIKEKYQEQISYRTILRFMVKNNIPCTRTRKYELVREKTRAYSDQWLREQIDNCISISKLAIIMSVSTTAITRRLKEAGLKPYSKYPLWWVREHWAKFKRGDENGKYVIKYFSNKLSELEPRTPAEIYNIIKDKGIVPGGMVLEPFAWTGTTALAAAKAGVGYIGITHSPGIYSNIQRMIEFLGLKNINIQYGELNDLIGVNFDMIIMSIPGLSMKIDGVLTTKKWCRGMFEEIRKWREGGSDSKDSCSKDSCSKGSEENPIDNMVIVGPEKVKKMLTF